MLTVVLDVFAAAALIIVALALIAGVGAIFFAFSSTIRHLERRATRRKDQP